MARRTSAALLVLLATSTTLAPAQQTTEAPLPKFEAIPPGERTQSLPTSPLATWKAVVLGVVEGITEYLPVSSTGHLAVAERLLGIGRTPEDKNAADAYAICIQGGAILAVLIVSLKRIGSMLGGIVGRDREGLRLLGRLALAFLPAAVMGYLLEGPIRERLFGIWPVVAAWILGGVAILGLTRWQTTSPREGGPSRRGAALESLRWQDAIVIGFAQSVALWPGVSRSLVTIVAGMLLGLSVAAAVEFSFLLGLVTLAAATGYEALTSGREIVAAFGWLTPLAGFVVAAATAFLAVRWMIGWLKTRSLAVFGWYRIAIGVAVAIAAFSRFV